MAYTDTIDIEDYIKTVKEWRSEDSPKPIQDILIRIQSIKEVQNDDDIKKLLQSLTVFHKEINRASEKEEVKIEEVWFQEVQKAKKHLKKIQEEKKKKTKIEPPKLIKSNSAIQYPEDLLKGKSELQKQTAKVLYKNFIINMEESITTQQKEIMDFVDKLIDCLFEEFGIVRGIANKEQQKTQGFFERLQKINVKLSSADAMEAKKEMMKGKIDAKLVSQADPEAFVSEEGKRIRQERIEATVREFSTGFYDEMKKNINKDACEECRYCHRPTAYCEDMKQIRAADEPMTRFMICNSCGKRWRQE